MKLTYKILITIALSWICFLALTSAEAIRIPIISYLVVCALFFIATMGLAYYFLTKYASQVNHPPQKQEDIIQPTQPLTQSIVGSLQHSHYDDLTSMPNRMFFNETLNKAISHARRHHKNIAILLIDIDNFKKINADFGREIGDEVLKEVGKRFASTIRSEDVLAHLDGDEFVVLLNDISKPKFASAVAEKIMATCAVPIRLLSAEIKFTASVGICIYPNDGESLEELLKNLDSTLYKVKHAGGNAYQFYTEQMDIEAREYIQLEGSLRKAIQNNELVLHYQPKLHIKNGNIAGVEALLRWEHPELGLLHPAKFIALAEEIGLMTQIGEWTIREACKTNKQWQNEGYEHLTMAVNLSSAQFNQNNLAESLTSILNETGLNPQYLELEITETTVMTHIDKAKNILEKIKETGVQISLDHFGTGYTSISHLKQFPIRVVKVDQVFIKGVPNNPDDAAITSAMIALAHNLGLEVVAEGVETAEQVEYLGAQNCDIVQGYFLSHPLPAQKIIAQFKKLTDEVIL
jgi:diguanylate cyclase (GGDEF)-like protein